MKAKLIILILITAVFLSGCVSIDAPVTATSNPVGTKVGQAGGVIILGFGDIDASIRTAAANAGISEISTVDIEIRNVLGVYQRFTTTVTGE